MNGLFMLYQHMLWFAHTNRHHYQHAKWSAQLQIKGLYYQLMPWFTRRNRHHHRYQHAKWSVQWHTKGLYNQHMPWFTYRNRHAKWSAKWHIKGLKGTLLSTYAMVYPQKFTSSSLSTCQVVAHN